MAPRRDGSARTTDGLSRPAQTSPHTGHFCFAESALRRALLQAGAQSSTAPLFYGGVPRFFLARCTRDEPPDCGALPTGKRLHRGWHGLGGRVVSRCIEETAFGDRTAGAVRRDRPVLLPSPRPAGNRAQRRLPLYNEPGGPQAEV